MKSVATAKFKQAQRRVLESRPNWHNYPELAAKISAYVSKSSHPLLERRKEKKIKVLVLSSDKGLAGAFNSNLLEETQSFLEERSLRCDIRLILLGRKADLFFKKTSFPIERAYVDRVQKLSEEELKDLAGSLMQEYIINKSDAVYVAYNEFKSILSPQVTITRLLPLEFQETEEGEVQLIPDWEPGMISFLNTVLPLYIEGQVWHFYCESIAAEHAARMMAMDNATNNAEDLIDDLTLSLNKLRQASITTELLEIISAVEALAQNR
jgi:F-type H+-transporting ATPase subunit gamma